MKGYICTKACTFGGVAFKRGDAIPFAAVDPSRERALISQGIIAKNDNEVKKAKAITPADSSDKHITVPLNTKDGDITLYLTEEDIVAAVGILQMTADPAAEVIKEISDEALLIFVTSIDSRKAVKTAADAKLKIVRADAEKVQESVQQELEPPSEEDKGDA